MQLFKYNQLWVKCTSVFLTLLFPVWATAQVLDYIDVQVNIIEKVGNELKPLPNAQLNITDIGAVTTDNLGQKAFTYPIRNNVDPQISIALVSDQHRTLKPLDSSIAIDTSSQTMVIDFLVVNMANENAAFKKRIADLEKRMSKLKAKNQLTQQQIRALGEQLMDTIIYYENVREELVGEIANLENLTDQQKLELDSKNEKIARLEERIDFLTEELAAAREEHFLRQKKCFDNVTKGLRAYIRTAKDLKDHLPFVQSYFSSPSGFENFKKDIERYNDLYAKLDEGRAGYLENVENYWENKRVVKDLEEVFEYSLRTIHMEQVRPAMSGVYDEFLKQRPKKAQKFADAAYENMNINLKSLEQMINRVETKLRNIL